MEVITLKKDPLRLENTEKDLGMELSLLIHTDSMGEVKLTNTRMDVTPQQDMA